jgi:hypothetical protein
VTFGPATPNRAAWRRHVDVDADLERGSQLVADAGSRTAANAAVGGHTTPSTAVMIVANSVEGSMAVFCDAWN